MEKTMQRKNNNKNERKIEGGYGGQNEIKIYKRRSMGKKRLHQQT